ncbi:MAG: PilZ domain-containing protein [Myxococcales bacterium]|nr:PilZ domain-containing protein [Myxococcales bacterium]
MDRPRALVIHDGELDRFVAALERAGVAPLAAAAEDVRDGLPMPCDLLVSTGRRTLAMPALSVAGPGAAPTWICVHTQDFHPLRERLRALGVHFLVQASIEERPLELFLAQLLHRGRERRREPRLPVGASAALRWKGRTEKVTLVDVSATGARLDARDELPVGAVVELELPSVLVGRPLAVHAQVARSEPIHGPEGERREAHVVWHELAPDHRLVIEELAAGRRIGPRVAPLAPAPYVDGTGIPDWGDLEQEGERRSEPRRRYRAHVDTFSNAGPTAAIGRDLSHRGVCIETGDASALRVGDEVTVALHAGGRDEPVLATARVERRNTDASYALLFGPLDDEARAGLDRILDALPVVSAVGEDDGRVVPAEIAGLAASHPSEG